MRSVLPGIGGSLLPARYLAAGLDESWLRRGGVGRDCAARVRRWWEHVAGHCGPASGVRVIFDMAAMPLFALLGFRARGAVFEAGSAHVRLETDQGTTVALVVLPWARRPSARWRTIVEASRGAGAAWAFVLAPPFLSLVDVRGHATRHSVEFTLPEALDDRSVDRFLLLTCAAAFDPDPSASVARGAGAVRTRAGRVPPSRLDRLVAGAATYQDHVRADLQRGVVRALAALGPTIAAVRAPRDAGSTTSFEQALTLVYRLLFLLFAESRDLVPVRHRLYGEAYSVSALCRDAVAHPDRPIGLWDGLAAITRLSRVGCRMDDLIVRPFNGRLFARAAAPALEQGRTPTRLRRDAARHDEALGRALTAIGTRRGPAGREEIAYADLGVEQLGAVYERVLDLDPAHLAGDAGSRAAARADFPARHSARRKQTGTFYTPQALAEFVVRRTLAPLVRGASADAILRLRVVDPAMGSGAFLVAACRYLAAAYERALVDEGRCAETDLDDRERATHRRLIAERCLAGVDLNPVAVQLARLSVWLTTLAHGKPLSFLDHRLRVGNSLVGASPDDLWRMSDGFARGSLGARPLFDSADLEQSIRLAARPLRDAIERPGDTVADVRAKETAWMRFAGPASPLDCWRAASSLWCARFFWSDAAAPNDVRRPSAAECRAAIDAIVRGDRTLAPSHVRRLIAAAARASAARAFFHWPLEFPDVYFDPTGAPRTDAGFDAVIGNPPWEMLRRDESAPATAAPHRDLIAFIRGSGLYPACGRGHVNLYQPFLERALSLVRRGGRVGLILPWGLATDDGAADLRQRLLDRCGQVTILGLDNAAALFPIHRGLRFAAIAATRDAQPDAVRARFGVRTTEDVESLPDADDAAAPSGFARLDAETLGAIGGPSRRIPDLRRPGDLEWLRRIVREFPAVGAADGWGARFGRELNVTEDRESFVARGLPVIGGKHIVPFAVRAGGVSCRIGRDAARRLLPDCRYEAPRLGYRDVSGVGNRLSLIAAIVPADVVTTHTIFCLRSPLPIAQQHFLCALFNSYVLNAVVRMLMGAHVTTSLVEGLPVPRWTGAADQRRIARLADRLARRPASRRLNAALQAAVARQYGVDAVTFAAIVESFPLVPRADRDAAVAACRRAETVADPFSVRPS